MTIHFRSDVVAGASPEVLAALARANEEDALPFGQDAITERVTERLSAIFDRRVWATPVGTGTAANVIALAAVVPPGRSILCHEAAHIFDSEVGGVEFYTHGARLVPVPDEHGRLLLSAVTALLSARNARGLGLVPGAVSVTQLTEWGAAYRVEEVRALSELAHRHGLPVHMDGARLANALVTLGATPADATWRAGVDVLSLGGTKNGTMAADAVLSFDEDVAKRIAERARRGGHRIAKMRFVTAQLDAVMADDLWLRNARRANAAAQRLAEGLRRLPDVSIERPVDGNLVFARIPEPVMARLRARGIELWLWHEDATGAAIYRLVTSFRTTDAEIDKVLRAAGTG